MFTYRDAEVPADHPLHRVLAALAGRRVHRLALAPLAAEERVEFPLLRRYVHAHDYGRTQKCTGLAPELLPFVVPWLAHHAWADELPRMLAEASWGMHTVLRIFDRRFAEHRRLALGPLP